MGDAWPLIGRAAELRTITEAAARPDTGGVVIVGPPGVGRTRLAREAVARLDGPVSWATGTRAAGTIALGALLHLGPSFGEIVERFSAGSVLVVDDTHLLDSASAALVHQLAVHTGTFVLLTVRQGRATPDVVTALWKERVAQRVDLLPLGDDDVDTLLERGLGGPLDAVTRRTLRRLSAGNPLVLHELVQSGLDGAALRRVDGLWHLDGQLQVTGRLGDLVEAQMQVDDPGVLAVLEVLACKEPLAQPFLEGITGHSAVVRAERRGLVVVEPSGARLTIPAYGEVIRARMPRARARAIWERLGGSLDSVDLALWRPDASAQELLAGAQQAADRQELGVAERLAVAALPLGGADANLMLAEVLVLQGRYGEAAKVLPASGDCSDADRADMLRERISYWQHAVVGSGDGPGALSVRTWTMLLEGHVAQSLTMGTALLARPHLPARAMKWAATAVVIGAGLVGDMDRHDDPAARCLALMLCGALEAGAAAAETAYAEAVERRTAQQVGMWAAIRGALARAQGRVKVAQQSLREAVVLLDGHDPLRLRRVYLSELAATHAMAGDTVQAEAWLNRMDACPAPPGVLFDPWIERNRAWVIAATLDLPGAAARALGAAKTARALGAPMIEALALFDAARFGAAAEVRERLSDLASTSTLPVTAAFATVAGALAHDDAHQLGLSAETLHDAGYLLPAAEAAATAYRLHIRAGRRTLAKNTLVRARELLTECGGARTPLTMLTGSEASLTPRELQVAKLIAAGLSGRAVANRLGLSLRTVNNHLGRVYAKLGVSGRHSLSQILNHPPPPSA
ncbi:LuxR C-terminal-related transcriptional regulator [Nonomuraea sp. NPDC050556]|uniref:LuxR C-terminal-related transcriptional regulator n=1 Tax=Nonomuraea sp. NPDC050556 TaxID=3364369 RepID=UPI00379A317C